MVSVVHWNGGNLMQWLCLPKLWQRECSPYWILDLVIYIYTRSSLKDNIETSDEYIDAVRLFWRSAFKLRCYA